MKKILFLVLVVTVKFQAAGQSNFVDAIVITSAGDSLAGKIDFRGWRKTPETIIFENKSGERQSFNPESIRSYTILVQKQTYISRLVDIDMTPDDPDKVLRANITTPSIVQKTVFMLELVKSPALSIYEFTDYNNKNHFYYSGENNKPVELVHHYLYTEQDGRLQHNTEYMRQLTALLSGCPAITGKISHLRYDAQEIQELVVRYLNCITPESKVEVKKIRSLPVKAGLIAGIMHNSYKFKGVTNYQVDGDYTSNTSPVVGISLDVGLSRSYDRLRVINELIYKRYKTRTDFSGVTSTGFSYEGNAAFDFSYVQLNTMLHYVIVPLSALKPFVHLGIANGFIVEQKENTVHSQYSTNPETTQVAIEGPRKYELSFLAGAGLNIKKIILELRYGYAQKAFSPSDLDIIVKSPQLLVTYQF